MSRIGIYPVTVPEGVEVNVSGQEVSVKGKLGSLTWRVPAEVAFEHKEGEVSFEPRNKGKKSRALWGTSRAIVANMVHGVSQGFTKKLLVQGVGYRSSVQGNVLDVSVGYSHPVKMQIPEGLKVQVNDNTEIEVSGYDKHQVGQFAANVRAVRPPEPYKGKGIRYADERVRMKEGKKK